MGERRRIRRRSAIALTLAGGLLALTLWQSRRAPEPPPPPPQAACELAVAPCVATFSDGGEVQLAVSPPGLPSAQRLLWQVDLPSGLRAERIELTGLTTPTDKAVVTLTEAAGASAGHARFEGQAALPPQPPGRMLWRADLHLVQVGGSPRVAAFEFWAGSARSDSTPAGAPALVDSLPSPTAPGYAPFTVDSIGGPLSTTDLQGRVVVLTFGYTACPDFCPTTLSILGAALRSLDPDQQDQVAGLMVSLDPDRDSVDRLDQYTRHFHPVIQGGTAPVEQLDAITADWGVPWRKVPLPGSAFGYAIDHGTDSFLLGRDGSLRRRLPHGTTSAELATLLREALEEDTADLGSPQGGATDPGNP